VSFDCHRVRNLKRQAKSLGSKYFKGSHLAVNVVMAKCGVPSRGWRNKPGEITLQSLRPLREVARADKPEDEQSYHQ
jgi:hypothetical protein